jgi:hypothetical protein
MKLNNINGLIDRIICKKIYFTYQDKWYYYKFPNSDIRMQGNLLYDETFDRLKYDDIILEEDVDFYLQEYEVVDYPLRSQVERLNKKLDNLKIDLFKNFFMDSKQKKIKRNIANLRINIEQEENMLHYLDRFTIENICLNIQNEFLLLNGIHDKNHNLIFDSNRLDDVDQILFNNLSQEIGKKFLKSSEYRQIARSSNWKALWNIKNHDIFGEPISEWSEEQKTLISISQMYDNIYQHPDCPDDKVIEDDDALDGWSLLQSSKIKEEKKKSGVDNIVSKHKNAQEIFMVAETQEDIENIIGLNSNEGLSRMKSKLDFVTQTTSSGKSVKEIEVPQVQQDLMQKTLQAKK